MDNDIETWQKLIGELVVIDTNSPFIYLGKLVSCDEWFITLADVDVHDQKEGCSTKEQYINEAKKSGIKVNRKQVVVRKDQIISFSRLEDVVVY